MFMVTNWSASVSLLLAFRPCLVFNLPVFQSLSITIRLRDALLARSHVCRSVFCQCLYPSACLSVVAAHVFAVFIFVAVVLPVSQSVRLLFKSACTEVGLLSPPCCILSLYRSVHRTKLACVLPSVCDFCVSHAHRI